MKPMAFDTETYLINQNGKASTNIIPRLVCVSFCDDEQEGLVDRRTGVDMYLRWLDEGRMLIGLNLAFDLAVMHRAVMEEYPTLDETAVFSKTFYCVKYDLGVAAKLLDIAIGGMFLRGRYGLAALVKRFLGVEMGGKSGPDVWRLRYNELDGVPIEDWPEAASAYALDDARLTWQLFNKIKDQSNPNEGGIALRSHYDFCLHLMSAWGLMVDQTWADGLLQYYTRQLEDAQKILVEAEIIVDGTKKQAAVQALVESAWQSIWEPPVLTPAGKIKTDAKTMKELEAKGVDEPLFKTYSLFNRAQKFMATYLEPLGGARQFPLCPRYNVIVNSGRTSSSGPNVQNFPSRESDKDFATMVDWAAEGYEASDEEEADLIRVLSGYVTGPDIRGAFVPRTGCVFVGADYSALELATFAQVYANLHGRVGTMGEAINQGIDLHTYMAAQMDRVPYAEMKRLVEAKDPKALTKRQLSKVANFGFPGGASAKTFVEFAAGMGVKVDLATAEAVKVVWEETWTEVRPHFLHVARSESYSGNFHVQQHGPGRQTRGWRLRVTDSYTAASNTLFQGLAADGALYAVAQVVEACYCKPESPLYGSRLLLFIHDELVIESPEEKAQEAAQELSRIMVEAMRVFTPDIKIEAKPEIMVDRWRK